MPSPIRPEAPSTADKARALDGLETAIARQVAEHPAFGAGLMQEIKRLVDPASLRELVAALSNDGRPFKPAVPTGDLRQVLAEAPDHLGSKFVFENERRIRAGYSQFDINPAGGGSDPTLESTAINPNELGGVTVKAGSGLEAFTGASWIHDRPLSDYVTPSELRQLKDAGFVTDRPTSVLVLKNSSETDPVVLAFGGQPWGPGQVACICTKVTVVTLDGRSDFFLEKPVVYFYPEKKTSLSVTVELDGQLIAEYPKSESGRWSFIATPDGTLFDPRTERKFGYLFWEGKAARGFVLDARQAFCVRGDETAAFLEKVSDRFGFNDRERTDFVTYWLARLERNPYNLIQFLSEPEYDAYAKMTVEPKPDTLIRLFMIYQGVAEPVVAGAPELPLRLRRGFTVVEWGGCELR